MPFLYFPVNRSVASFVSSVVLSNGEERDKKRAIESAWSKYPASISEWALWRVGARLRGLQEGNVPNAKEAMRNEPSVSGFSENLGQLGYEWDIDCIDRNKNTYELILKKEGFSFNSAFASSGEKEILVFLMGVYLLNVEDSLVIIDEPELHLHPKWQKFLINILTNISNLNGSQFIIATHSPFFITPKTLGFVNRVFNDGKMSLNVNFEKELGVDGKHLLSIVNSQNNECIFFSDYVVLVDGIIDKVVFELIFEHKIKVFKNKFNLEVVCVGGKYMFKQYERLLKGCGVKHSVVGDFDYLMEVGNQCIKGLFKTSIKKIRKKMIGDRSSEDGAALLDSLEKAIEHQDFEKLRSVFDYIKSRYRRIEEVDMEANRVDINENIKELNKRKIFILPKGSIEKYLPIDCSGKDVDKLIELKDKGELLDWVINGGGSELSCIADRILDDLKS